MLSARRHWIPSPDRRISRNTKLHGSRSLERRDIHTADPDPQHCTSQALATVGYDRVPKITDQFQRRGTGEEGRKRRHLAPPATCKRQVAGPQCHPVWIARPGRRPPERHPHRSAKARSDLPAPTARAADTDIGEGGAVAWIVSPVVPTPPSAVLQTGTDTAAIGILNVLGGYAAMGFYDLARNAESKAECLPKLSPSGRSE